MPCCCTLRPIITSSSHGRSAEGRIRRRSKATSIPGAYCLVLVLSASVLNKSVGTSFFAEFERANLAFVYRDASPNGHLDDLDEFVRRAVVPELTISGRSTIAQEVM